MATYEKIKLSGGGNHNAPVDISASLITSSWITIHETGTSSTILDEVWLWVSNPSSTDTANLYMRCHNGSTGVIVSSFVIPPATSVLALGGYPISGNGSVGQRIQFYDFSSADTNSMAYGYVNRITP
jgi:hypothetical protein